MVDLELTLNALKPWGVGRYYLVDGGYANQPGFLAPYRTARYHLADFRRKNPVNSKEVFNNMHSQA